MALLANPKSEVRIFAMFILSSGRVEEQEYPTPWVVNFVQNRLSRL